MRSRSIKSFECESSSSTVQASSHFDHIPFIPSFYALVSPSNIAWLGIDNMWVLGSSWWGRNLLPCIQTLGVTFTLCLYCHAMLVDVDWVWVYSMTYCEIVYLMDQLKVATLIHIWVDWLRAPGESSVVLGYPGGPVWSSYGSPPRLKGIIRLFMLETSVCRHKPLWALA